MQQSAGRMWEPVMHELLDRIVEGSYAPGTIIPTESELGSKFGISRTVLREAVKILAEKGLVATRRGLGTTVEPVDSWRMFDPAILSARLRLRDGDVVIRELLILRKAIEPELASMAADRCDASQLARLGVRLAKLEDSRRHVGEYVLADADFHREIVAIADVGLAQEIFRIMEEPINLARERTIRLPGALEVAHAQHERIFASIRDRDSPAAAAAMSEHIQWNQDRL